MHVYIQQFGAFWKAPLGQWLTVCQNMVSDPDYGYDLDELFKRLKTKPRFLINEERGSTRYTSSSPDKIYIVPLDWEKGDYEGFIKEYGAP